MPIQQVVLNAINNIEKASKLKGSVTGIPTGFIDLDYKTSGNASVGSGTDSSTSLYGKDGICFEYCTVYGIS